MGQRKIDTTVEDLRCQQTPLYRSLIHLKTLSMVFDRIVHCLNLPPIRIPVMSYLSAMDVTNLSKSLGLELTECEQKRYLNPAKDVIDLSRMDLCSIAHTPIFLGRDLMKPVQTLQSDESLLNRQPVEITLLLLSCLCPCCEHAPLMPTQTIDAIQRRLSCTITLTQAPNDLGTVRTVLIQPLKTLLYIIEPEKNPSDHSNVILYLERRLLTMILDVSRRPATGCFVDQHMTVKKGTVLYQNSFSIIYSLWETTYFFYLFGPTETGLESRPVLNFFLVSKPGRKSFRRPWCQWIASIKSSVTKVASNRSSTSL